GSALDPSVVSQLVGRHRRDDPVSQLTPREREALELMAEGLSNSAIAERLVVTERAVEKHVTSIFGKLRLGADSDTHRRVLAVLARLAAHAAAAGRPFARERVPEGPGAAAQPRPPPRGGGLPRSPAGEATGEGRTPLCRFRADSAQVRIAPPSDACCLDSRAAASGPDSKQVTSRRRKS